MRLLTGPPGSGKTASVLEEVTAAVRSGCRDARLLVPTATLARHLANRLAREGLVFRNGLVETLSGFVKPWVEDLPQAPDSCFHLIVEEAVRQTARPEFERVAHLPGFAVSLARTMAEFSSAGCDSARLKANLPEAPLAGAFLAVYEAVDRTLERRGLALRSRRLAAAAARIAAAPPAASKIWMDGFHALPDPELQLIAALGRSAELTLTLGDGPATAATRSRLLAIGFREERARGARPGPALELVRAPNLEREAVEIARRILEQAAAGRSFREMGIIVRAADTYVPLLRSTLERFGIPARFYFDSRLDRHPAARLLAGAVNALLSGWDHAATLAALRLAPRLADSTSLDGFDFEVRAQLPDSGIGALRGMAAENRSLTGLIEALAALEDWRGLELPPRDWAERLGTLRRLADPAIGEISRPVHEIARSQTAALAHVDEALRETAAVFDPERAVGLETFWRAFQPVLRLKPMREDDDRRNVVHVLSAHEGRQWVLPVVFVCGMVERQFPQLHPQDAFFPDAARAELNGRGIRVRTAAEFEREERALFDSAVSRATMATVLTYPEFDARGERNLPSLYLEGLGLAAREAPPVVPPGRRTALAPPAPGIHAPDLAPVLERRTARLSPTALELYLRCPFEYFAARTLRLESPPCRPEERFDFIAQGELVHEVLAEWWNQPQAIEPLFERTFARYLEERLIPAGYHTERLRNTILDDLRAFAADTRWPRAGFTSRAEEEFVFALGDGLEISGKIDRLDTAPDGTAYVIDYKYSAAARTREKLSAPDLLQAPMYLMAAGEYFRVRAAGMFYLGLKGGVEYAGWSEGGFMKGLPFPENWLENTRARALEAVREIRSGRVERAPADGAGCRRCDFRDMCRMGARRGQALGEGA